MNHKIKIPRTNALNEPQFIEVELTEEQIIELHSRLQNKGEKYFFPEDGEKAWYISTYGDIDESLCWTGRDKEIVDRGVFKTEEQAKKEDEKRLALVRMWKYVQENGLYWEPDFVVDSTAYPAYNYKNRLWESTGAFKYRTNFLFPHFKTSEDCQKFIDNNLSDLNLFV